MNMNYIMNIVHIQITNNKLKLDNMLLYNG